MRRRSVSDALTVRMNSASRSSCPWRSRRTNDHASGSWMSQSRMSAASSVGANSRQMSRPLADTGANGW